ncbi:TPK_B1_binding domain-containing protein [Meloidogyne graminicola]|uniref:TPK_B1_binding domain-containing protein n=1 Tax=Meloidogyne graminicola TaxID=189291 RepID=A0A8S9ZJ30_9BILA|nr:TPK_B1_binding domain-containing protein [Meloidogyne graminicola]
MISRLFKPFDFVRKNTDQLAVIAVDSPKGVLPNEWFTVWNNSKLRLCTDGAANNLMEYCKSTKSKDPHMVVGDFDSITEESKKYFELQKDCQVKTGFLGEKPLGGIIILGGLTGRFDHVMGIFNAMMLQIQNVPTVPVYLLDNTNVVMIIQQGDTNIELLEEAITGTCGIIPLVQRRTLVTTEGFKWELNNKESKLDYGHCVSSSNKIVKPKLRILTSEPILFTFELKRSFGLNKT